MMNFLSHYYFERHTDNPYIVLGMVLPDLIRNADKTWNPHPQKHEHLFNQLSTDLSLLTGWKTHLEVDRLFHNSQYFTVQTANLKKFLLPALKDSPVKPFFLAHIGVELMLDQQLLHHQKINADRFYDQLQEANTPQLHEFLRKAGIPDIDKFDNFYQKFISSRYLFSYNETKNVGYALTQICKRVWKTPFTEDQSQLLIHGLNAYHEHTADRSMEIFSEIEQLLPSRGNSPLFSD